MGDGIQHSGHDTTDDDMPDLMSSSVSSSDEEVGDTLRAFQTNLRMEHQERHMDELRSRINTKHTDRAIELQWQEAFNAQHVQWLEEADKKDPLGAEYHQALREQYDLPVRLARSDAGVDPMDLVSMTAGERWLLGTTPGPSACCRVVLAICFEYHMIFCDFSFFFVCTNFFLEICFEYPMIFCNFCVFFACTRIFLTYLYSYPMIYHIAPLLS